ncbi:MAG: putative Ig domain-containing protein, partial [Hormoscilla sp. GUM202]|nr:putative Ig domain-containing protein [Hormoscilla sp. GUM202]
MTLNPKDYAALKALYNSTSGKRWKNKTGWDFTSETPDASEVNSWHGVTVVGSRVTKIQLNKNKLSGTIPSSLGSLGNLQVLDLDSNSLSGTIPSALGNLSNLQYLWLHGNDLSGTIPSALGNLSNLQYLWLYWTDLSGTLPPELGELGNLLELQLFWTDLSGTLPPELGDLSNLQELRLPNNDLSGTLPSSLGDLSNLQVLRLQSNDLSGSLPSSLGKLGNLRQLFLDNNSLSGTIPSSYGKLSNLHALDLRFNSLSGTVPSELGELGDLTIAYENNPLLDANDYAALKAFYSSTSGDNWSNQTGWNFSSEIPPSANAVNGWHGVAVVDSRVTAIDLPSNSLSGTLPSSLGDLGNLQELDLSENDLSGTLPSSLGDLGNLHALDLPSNSLSGTLPSSLGDLGNLQQLDLSDNSLSGTLPSSLGNLQDLNLENPPYVETQIPEVYAASGDNFNLNVSAHFGDINNNIASYGAEGLPDGLTIDSNSGALGGTPTTEGTFPVTVTVEDTAGGEVEDEFNIVVSSLDSSIVGKGFPLKRGSILLYAG